MSIPPGTDSFKSVMLQLVYITDKLFVTARMYWLAAAGQEFGLWQFPTHSSETPRLYRGQTAVSACSCRQTGNFLTALHYTA